MNFSKKNDEHHKINLFFVSKKVFLIVTMIALVSFTMTSCKKDKADHVKSETEVVDEVKQEAKEVLASNDVLYQCPMDCEKGKSYTEAGKCGVCKMDLKEKKVDVEEETEEPKDSVR